MGRRGPAPTPTALRLINGEREATRRNEPVPRSGELACPDGVSDEVRDVWQYTVAELEHMTIDAPTDRDALLCYCEAVVVHRKASAALQHEPLMIPGRNDTLVRNPLVSMQRDAANTVRAFAQEFGLTPSARSRIDSSRRQADDDENPFAAPSR